MKAKKQLSKLKIFFLLKKHLNFSYAPYSKFYVSCIIETKYNNTYSYYYGNNVENASYGLTICAERSAIFNYLSNKKINEKILNIYILATSNFNFVDYIIPCAACLGVMSEFFNDKNNIYCYCMKRK